MSSGRNSRGRQKIEMKKISKESSLQVTFSKRRSGLFKKASELSTLCGVEVAVIVFSPGDKVFSFGHPSVDTIIDRYLMRIPPQNNSTMQFIEAHRNAAVRELNVVLTQTSNTLDNEKRRSDELTHKLKWFEDNFWWARPINVMSKLELERFKNGLERLKMFVAQQAHMLASQGAYTQTLPFCVGNGSSSNMPFQHQPNPNQSQMFPAQFMQNPMFQPHLFDINNMRGGGGGAGGGRRGHGSGGFV